MLMETTHFKKGLPLDKQNKTIDLTDFEIEIKKCWNLFEEGGLARLASSEQQQFHLQTIPNYICNWFVQLIGDNTQVKMLSIVKPVFVSTAPHASGPWKVELQKKIKRH